MKCGNCEQYFCYRCNKAIDASNPYGHFMDGSCELFPREMVEGWQERINHRQVVGQIQAELFHLRGSACPSCRQFNAKITERLRDPRGGLGRGALSACALRTNGLRQRPFLRPGGDRNDSEDHPPAKRRLSSAVVKVDDGELLEDADAEQNLKTKDSAGEGVNGTAAVSQSDRNPFTSNQSGWSGRDGNQRTSEGASEIPTTEHVPRILPKNNRNRRMLGQLLETLEKFRKEDTQLSGTEAYMRLRRSNSLQRAEQRAGEESERLRKEEREQITEKRRRDLTLRARVAAKTEEKKLKLLFLSEHH